MANSRSFFVLLSSLFLSVYAQKAGSIVDGGDTLVSAMMMFVGNNEKVYILDKVEGNDAQVNGHSAWASVWDMNTHQATVMDVSTNPFCASGMHLPDGTFVTLGGNGAIGPGGNIGSKVNNQGSADFDDTYKDFDGGKSIRKVSPCTSKDDMTSSKCQWKDDPATLSMQKKRWYAGTEPLANGTLAIIGGYVNGGYVNRNYPVSVYDPNQGGAAENTYEFYPSNGQTPQTMQFLIKTGGLNSYAHTFLLASGKMLVQANVSAIIWDYNTNQETPLPDMPNNVARNYPASGAVAMLPLRPSNNYAQSVLFCGGSDLPDEAWGNYSFPAVNTWEYPASAQCNRITPEPADDSAPKYEDDDNMLETRTMGQFIILPDGKMLVVNGAKNGTAGYGKATGLTPEPLMPFGQSMASDPVGTPALYDPQAPKGSRWSNAGFDTSSIARLYHSSALLLPDGSVMIAGGNPNLDVNKTTVFPTTYKVELFYPSYFSGNRPAPSGMPTTLTYGGSPFDLTLPASSYSGSASDAASNTTVVVTRSGFTTHAMNMGQRFLQLNNTFTVNQDASITLHVSQMPPKAELFQPGPAMLWVVVNGIPSKATFVIVGSGKIENQKILPVADLPASQTLAGVSGSGSGSGSGSSDGKHNSGVLLRPSLFALLLLLGISVL